MDLGAPVIDGDGVAGNYNLEGGDRPLLYGHQTAFWVMNDVGNVHESSGTPPIGIEVRVTAFALAEPALERHTFYRFEIVNRNAQPLEDAYVGFWADPDLGGAGDDYVGSDPARHMAFVYNASPVDETYGFPPPAFGYDVLSGGAHASLRYLRGTDCTTTDHPCDGLTYYRNLQGLWNDGTPMTEGGDGYQTSGAVTTWAYPGDPEQQAFWSEVNNGSGANPPGDRTNLISAGPFTLQPGEAYTFDLALLFAVGADHLNSVTALKAVSDEVQALYDGGTLFVPGPPPPPVGSLATPELVGPEAGAFFVDESTVLEWEPVTGAEGYRVELSAEPDFSGYRVEYVTEPGLPLSAPANEDVSLYWRVVALTGVEASHPSESRFVRLYQYEFIADPTAIVEVAHPTGPPCPDAGDPGCQEHGGNAVWLDPNSTADYYVSAFPEPVLTGAAGLFQHILRLVDPAATVVPDLEVRFTEACAAAGACLGVYGQPPNAPSTGARTIASVPFELWNVGDVGDPGDDVRMVPFLRSNTPGEEHADWADTFTATQASQVGEGEVPVTDQVYWMMPDRPDGYALFEQAALGFGGPGAAYHPAADGDDQNEGCSRGGYYVDFCFGGGGTFVPPISKMVLADLTGMGTTPEAGTVIRVALLDRLFVEAEDGPQGGAPEAAALRLFSPYPNPSRGAAVVPFEVEHAGQVQLSVYDVLGRRVGVLLDGPVVAGRHAVALDASKLPAGLYVLRLETERGVVARRLTVLR